MTLIKRDNYYLHFKFLYHKDDVLERGRSIISKKEPDQPDEVFIVLTGTNE